MINYSFVVVYKEERILVIQEGLRRFALKFPDGTERTLFDGPDGSQVKGWSFRKNVHDKNELQLAHALGALIDPLRY